MEEHLNRYLKKCAARGNGEKTIQNYRSNLLMFQRWLESERKELSQLTDEDIDDYTLYLRDLGTINTTTINNKLRDLRAFLKYGHTKGWNHDISVYLIDAQEPDILPFEDEQLKDIYEACMLKKTLDRVRDYTIMRLMEETGIRLGECMRLELSDVNLAEGLIKLRKTKNKKARDIYLTPAMEKDLILYLEARQHFLGKYEIKNCPYLWVVTKTPNIGKPLAPRTMQWRIQKYGELAGIPIRVSPHTFRHTFARNFIVAGGDISVLKELLGHSTLDMVLKYLRLFGKDKQNNYLKIMENREKIKKNNALKRPRK